MSEKKRKLTPKQKKWLKAYLNPNSPETFLNKSEAARVAGYACDNADSFGAIGWENFKKLEPLINSWINEEGLGENQLKSLLIEGLTAKETKFFSWEGQVTEQIDVIAWNIRAKYLELALKVQKLLTERHELTGKGGGPIKHAIDPWAELMDAVTKQNSDELPNRGLEDGLPDRGP